MPGCDGSLTTKDCKICNGTGFKVVPVVDKEFNRIKPTAAVCLGKKNETAEAYFPKLSLVPQLKEDDLQKIIYNLKNYLFIGDQQYALFSVKKLIVSNYYNNSFRVDICPSTLLIERYTMGKMQLSDYLSFDLMLLMLNAENDNAVFKSAVLELVKTRYLENKPTWVHVPGHKSELSSCKEYTPEMDHYIKDFKVIRKSLGIKPESTTSTQFSSI